MFYDSRLSFSLGTNVKRLRKEQELTKTALARMAGLCRPMLDKIEDGESNIRLSDVHQLADALCVEPTDLLFMPRCGDRPNRLELWF